LPTAPTAGLFIIKQYSQSFMHVTLSDMTWSAVWWMVVGGVAAKWIIVYAIWQDWSIWYKPDKSEDQE